MYMHLCIYIDIYRALPKHWKTIIMHSEGCFGGVPFIIYINVIDYLNQGFGNPQNIYKKYVSSVDSLCL